MKTLHFHLNDVSYRFRVEDWTSHYLRCIVGEYRVSMNRLCLFLMCYGWAVHYGFVCRLQHHLVRFGGRCTKRTRSYVLGVNKELRVGCSERRAATFRFCIRVALEELLRTPLGKVPSRVRVRGVNRADWELAELVVPTGNGGYYGRVLDVAMRYAVRMVGEV